jgi:hypothetical protein
VSAIHTNHSSKRRSATIETDRIARALDRRENLPTTSRQFACGASPVPFASFGACDGGAGD